MSQSKIEKSKEHIQEKYIQKRTADAAHSVKCFHKVQTLIPRIHAKVPGVPAHTQEPSSGEAELPSLSLYCLMTSSVGINSARKNKWGKGKTVWRTSMLLPHDLHRLCARMRMWTFRHVHPHTNMHMHTQTYAECKSESKGGFEMKVLFKRSDLCCECHERILLMSSGPLKREDSHFHNIENGRVDYLVTGKERFLCSYYSW